MKNTTITLDETTLKGARRYASQLGLSFNAWVKKIITDAIQRSPEESMSTLLSLADQCAGSSGGKSWTKDDIYERK